MIENLQVTMKITFMMRLQKLYGWIIQRGILGSQIKVTSF